MKTNTILKTVTYTQLAPLLHKLNPKLDIQTFSDGFELDYWLEKLGKELQNEQLIKLSKKFLCIGFDENETFTLVSRSYLSQQITTFLSATHSNDRHNDIVEKLINFSMADKIRVTNENYSKVENEDNNKARNLEILKGQLDYQLDYDTSLQDLLSDINSCGTMELYFDDISDILDTILPKNRLISPILLDNILDIICEVLSYELYIEDRQEKRRNVLVDEVDDYIATVSRTLNIDRFANSEIISEFIVNDIIEVTTLEEYSSEDIAIAFRRFVESDRD